MARRRKAANQAPIFIFLSLVAIAVVAVSQIPNLVDNLQIIIIVAIGILMLIGLGLIGLIYREMKRRERAITLSDVDNMTGVQFERYVEKLFKHQGYHTRMTKHSSDFGVDIIASKDGKHIAVQAKCYSVGHNVDRTAISDAVAGMHYYRCNQTLAITNRFFTNDAKTFANFHNCELVDRDKLTDWIMAFQKSA